MTVHQVKGLEFPFVFVGGISENAYPSSTHLIEDEFLNIRQSPPLHKIFTAEDRAKQDLARFFYVAYSRAQYSLIILATTSQLKLQRAAIGGKGFTWFRQKTIIL
jgi:DNA helicase-2/ATP-dependent DNA helicase PcrA